MSRWRPRSGRCGRDVCGCKRGTGRRSKKFRTNWPLQKIPSASLNSNFDKHNATSKPPQTTNTQITEFQTNIMAVVVQVVVGVVVEVVVAVVVEVVLLVVEVGC